MKKTCRVGKDENFKRKDYNNRRRENYRNRKRSIKSNKKIVPTQIQMKCQGNDRKMDCVLV